MSRRCSRLALLCALVLIANARADTFDAQRIAAIAAALPAQPQGVGRPIEDRAAWDALAQMPAYAKVIRSATALAKQPVPEVPDELYLDFSKTGNRRRYEAAEGKRHARITELALAECLENRGRFLPALEESLRASCAEKTWTLPAHDRKLEAHSGKIVDIDLWVAGHGRELATIHYWLGRKLSPDVRSLLEKELERRLFTPYRAAVRGERPKFHWMSATHNWNAVCLAGVTGAALAVLPDRADRAWFIAAAERYTQNFLNGFTPDGYCSEGLGYWNYGFGNYVLLAESVKQTTGGKFDWLQADKPRQVAAFGKRLEILPEMYPSFADCGLFPKPDARLMAFLSRRFGWGLQDYESKSLGAAAGPASTLAAQGVFGFPNSATAIPAATGVPPALRDWFSDAGILIGRPDGNRPHSLGVALKGGHNAEHHNHNDIGSYVVALDQSLPILDPGSEVYTARTFSAKRYDSKVLNSFGHPVPIVAGQLQKPGRDAQAKVLATRFTPAEDSIQFDLTSAYPVKELKSLVRTFSYSRQGNGKLIVTDRVEFSSPQKFGSALITLSPWKKSNEGTLSLGDEKGSIQVQIACPQSPWRIHDEEIHEDLHGKRVPVRLGIDLEKPVTRAELTVTIVPVAR